MAIDQGSDKSETEHGRKAHSIRDRIRKPLATIGEQIIGAAVTTAVLSVGFMVFNDYIAPPPNLAGRWKFTVVYEDTAYRPFQDLNVTYQALLIQEGLDLSGTGEKLSDHGPQGDSVEYSNDRRTNIQLVGNITRNYFSPDALVLHYMEAGRLRESSTLHQLEYFDAQTMCGVLSPQLPTHAARCGGRAYTTATTSTNQ